MGTCFKQMWLPMHGCQCACLFGNLEAHSTQSQMSAPKQGVPGIAFRVEEVATRTSVCCCGGTEAKMPALPWPVGDPPLTSSWKQHGGQAYHVTRHFSGYLHWQPAQEALEQMLQGKRAPLMAMRLAKAMLPLVNTYCGVDAHSQSPTVHLL